MNTSPKDDMTQRLAYFGKMTASISHDIKNYLAIINENTGLIQDLSMMASMGKELDPDRVSGLCKNIIAQIKRADDTVKSMNCFAHSTDTPMINICLGNTINLAMNISNGILKSRGMEVKSNIPQDIYIKTNPFFLMNLVWLIVDYLTQILSDNPKILLSTDKGEQIITICILFYGQDADSAVQSLLSMDSVKSLLFALGGRLEAGNESVLLITLPESLNQIKVKEEG